MPSERLPAEVLLQESQMKAHDLTCENEASESTEALTVIQARENVTKATGLTRTLSAGSEVCRVSWTVDSRKLKSMDREYVSPMFELDFVGFVLFRMVLRPATVHDNKGGHCFKRSKGRGSVELKCLEDVSALTNPVVAFRISVGACGSRGFQRPRGPVIHDLRDRLICGLPAGREQWDFHRAVDKPTKTFEVCLEVSWNRE